MMMRDVRKAGSSLVPVSKFTKLERLADSHSLVLFSPLYGEWCMAKHGDINHEVIGAGGYLFGE